MEALPDPPLTSPIACLGPEGSFSHLITAQRFPQHELKMIASVSEIFDFLAEHPQAHGVVPIENSSGGFIIDTVDRLVDERCGLHVLEELTLDVKLALLGHAGHSVEVIYSHPMPFFHCDEWLRANHPEVKRVPLASTAASARRAVEEPNAATIGPRQNAAKHGLDVLQFPIAGDVPNITQFFLLGRTPNVPATDHNRTALVVELPDRPGSLCHFLQPFSDASVSLKRIESRPLRGQPNKYRFYIELEGSPALPATSNALAHVTTDGATVRLIGSYSSGRRFES
jgi:prephenate dehydratase